MKDQVSNSSRRKTLKDMALAALAALSSKAFGTEADGVPVRETAMPSFSDLRKILLYSESLDEKIGAVHSLAVNKPQGSINEILETLKDPDGEMALHASLALASFGLDAIGVLRPALGRWGTAAIHPSRNTPINLRERLLYPSALLGSEGYAILHEASSDDNEVVQTSSQDLLSVIAKPLAFPGAIITVDITCDSLGWQLPPQIRSASKKIFLGTTSVYPITLSVIAVLCAHQGLFGEGLRGKQPINYYYDIGAEKILARSR